MAYKTNAEVLIGGKVYRIGGYESEDYLQRVAAYINGKINEFGAMDSFHRLPTDMKATLTQINIADDYFKAKARVEELEQEAEAKDKEIYNLKHDLISCQIKLESDEKTLKELQAENRSLQLNKADLETSLEDALLGKVDDSGTGKDAKSVPRRAAEDGFAVFEREVPQMDDGDESQDALQGESHDGGAEKPDNIRLYKGGSSKGKSGIHASNNAGKNA